ncbi:unnamed protein product [Caenorhabditis nigoni]
MINQGFFYGAAVFAPVQPGYAPMQFQPYPIPAEPLYTSWEALQPVQCYEEDTENQGWQNGAEQSSQGRSNFKARLCQLYMGRRTTCPHGERCRFAHGVEELRSSGSTSPDLQSKSYKTVLCRNYAPGGSGDCPYRLACQYIHPSDGLLYKFCMADTPEFKAAKEQHQKEVQVLHAQKSLAPHHLQFQLEVAINMKVRSFNVRHPNGQDYHDFHGMTTMGAVCYVQDIIKQMRSSGAKKAWLEVGRGNHSANGFPAVRTYLTNNLHLFSGCSFVPIQGNDGILELTVFP